MIPVGLFQFGTFCAHQHDSRAELLPQTVQAQLCKYTFKLVFLPLPWLPKPPQCIPQRQEFIPIARAIQQLESRAGSHGSPTLPFWEGNPGWEGRNELFPAFYGHHRLPCAAPAREYPGLLFSLLHHSVPACLVSRANTQRVFNSKSPQVTSAAKFPGQVNYLCQCWQSKKCLIENSRVVENYLLVNLHHGAVPQSAPPPKHQRHFRAVHTAGCLQCKTQFYSFTVLLEAASSCMDKRNLPLRLQNRILFLNEIWPAHISQQQDTPAKIAIQSHSPI